ncbi:MAG: hypothetical protein WEB60_08320 [Terrimicrobiaceae bacterium]
MGAVRLDPSYVSMRQLSLELGYCRTYIHECWRRGQLVGLPVERVGPRGWYRIRRGPELDVVVAMLTSKHGRPHRYANPTSATRHRREFLADLADGAVQTSPVDRHGAVAVLLIAQRLMDQRQPGERLRATLAALDVAGWCLALKRAESDKPLRLLESLIAGLESAGVSTLKDGENASAVNSVA